MFLKIKIILCTKKSSSMTVPGGLNECTVCSVVPLFFLKSLKARMLQCLWIVRNKLCPCKHIILIVKQQKKKKKKSCSFSIPAAFDRRTRKIICHCSSGYNRSIEVNGNPRRDPPSDSTPIIRALILQMGFWGRFSLESSKDFLKFLNKFTSERWRTASRWSICLLVQIE